MKKFISIFLVMSMIMCNLNTGVVEALSTYSNKVKSLTNTEKEKTVDVDGYKGLEKKIKQASTSNNLDKTKVDDSINKEKQSDSPSEKQLSIYEEGSAQEKVIFVYDITSNKFYYYYMYDNTYEEIPWLNKSIIKNNKINLNDLLKHSNLIKSDNVVQDATLLITGKGKDRYFYFDNNQYMDLTFNIIFYDLNGEDCNFSLLNVKSIDVIGKNTITNSDSYNTALTYSFNSEDLTHLNINNDSSFIVYNKDKSSINNNIVYDGDLEDLVGSSIVNISFKDDLPQEKNFIFEPVDSSNTNQKKFSAKQGFSTLSMLLVSDGQDYFLKEDGNSIPYYYMSNDSKDENNEILVPIKTKINLKKNSSIDCCETSNEQNVEVISNQNDIESYYLVNTLEEAMNTIDIYGGIQTFIFLGDYKVKQNDVVCIKGYNNDVDKVEFKTSVDGYKYSLKIDTDIELNVNNSDSSIYSVVFDDIKFKFENNNWIYANGRQVTFGYGVEMEGPNYPSVSLGQPPSSNFRITNNSSLVIDEGTYNFITGDCYSTLKNINLVINGGDFKNEVTAVSNNSKSNRGINNVTLTISNGTFSSKVCAATSSSSISENLKMTIQGGLFQSDVVAVEGKVEKDVAMTITGNPIFKSQVSGISSGSNISGRLNISIGGGIFKQEVVGVNGGIVKNATLTISNGTFDNMFIGALSNTTEKITLKGLFNRYFFSNNIKVDRNKENKIDSKVASPVNINIKIGGGNFKESIIGTNIDNSILNMTISKGIFKKSLVGFNGLANDNATININGSITIPIIRDFTKLVVGENKSGSILKLNILDKGHSTGDLYLKNRSKISFISTSETSELNNIILEGNNNALVLPSNKIINTVKEKVLINLYGNIQTKGNKLNVEFDKLDNNITSEIYLIKFEDISNIDITDKYNPQKDYYICDNKEPGYVILCPKITFDLKYDLQNDKLYMLKNGIQSEAWWYTENINKDVTLYTDKLYKYKGYDLFKDVKNKDRNIILTGTSLNKNITVNNNLSNVNLVLDNVNLTDSVVNIDKIKTLTLKGQNIIKSINTDKPVFTYTFNSSKNVSKVLFDKDVDSYLEVCTKKDISPFNGVGGEYIDLKFHKPFNEIGNEVRLKNNNTTYELNFMIPTGTERLGLLLKDKGSYNLYYGRDGDTGNSVYVSGNNNDTFTNKFETSSDNLNKVYEYVRRANPINKVSVDMPSEVNFGVNVQDKRLDEININNWKKHFYATKLKFKNNSTIIEDEFIDDEKNVHHFNTVKSNADLKLEYMGVSSLWDTIDGIELVSRDKIKPEIITDGIFGVKLALKLDDVVIDESIGTENTLGNWIIKDSGEQTIMIEPDFGNNNHFFNISKNRPNSFMLDSCHKFIFRYGLKDS